MSGFRLFGRPEAVVREVEPGSATSHARPARRAEDLLAPPGSELGFVQDPRWGGGGGAAAVGRAGAVGGAAA
ncbi:hypothetical protein, partial [Pseudonocardia pini]|uniref:hypothetical protein n=1 Tax=Pseudonocardia pini TaxID=2758030 RepID=UPI001C69072D